MRKTTSTLLISFICMIALATAALSANTSKATVTAAPSAAEQLARARQALQQMQQASGTQKMDLFAQAWGNLALVRKQWPNDKAAIVRSGIMQADLAIEFGAPSKAIDPLIEVLPAAAGTDSEPQVEVRLGQAYEGTGDATNAEKHLLAAERAIHARGHSSRVEAEGILSTLAVFYAHHDNPNGAIPRFREAENLPGQDVINKAHFQLKVAEQAARIGRDAAAPELAQFDDRVLEARKTNLTPADATWLNDMVQEAQRIRAGNPKH